MIIEKINPFTIISILISVLIIILLVFVISTHKKRKAAMCFYILSIVNLTISVCTFTTLVTDSFNIAHLVSQILAGALFLSPIALMCFAITVLDAELSKINRFFRLLLYVPSIIITVVLISTKSVSAIESQYGYILYAPNLMIIDTFYFITIYLIIIAIISFEINKNKKNKDSNKSAIILLSGLIFYFFGNLVYYILHITDIVDKLPTQSVYLFVIYIFAAAAMFNSKKI